MSRHSPLFLNRRPLNNSTIDATEFHLPCSRLGPALYFHLYGLDRDDAAYVLGTFPIVQRDDEKQFGRYRTRDVVLAYMNALAAADTEMVRRRRCRMVSRL